MRDLVDVAVIGAGAAGIAAARRALREPGLSVLALEAASRIGGRAHTIPAPVGASGGTVPLDLGCLWLHGALDNAWCAVAGASGFAVDRRPAPWAGEGRGLGRSAEEQADCERALERFHAAAEAEAARGGDGPLSDLVPAGDRWRGLIDAISTYVSGVETDRVSVADAAGYAPGAGGDWRVVAGYGTLVADHGREVEVALGTPALAVDHSGAEAIRIETPRGTLRARAAIVTVSTDVLAAGAIRFSPALPDTLAAAAALPLGLADKLWLEATRPELFPLEGYMLGSNRTARTAAYHLRPLGRPVVECFYGGALARDLEAGGEAAALDFARAEIAGRFGGAAAASLRPLHMTAWGRDPAIRGSYAYAVPGAAGARARLAAPVDDRLFFAGEACSPARYTTAHGAYETGVAAAERAVASLRARDRRR